MHDSFIQIISHVFVFNDLCHTQTAVPISNSSGDLRASSEREDKSSSRAVLTRALYLSSNLALPREMERERERMKYLLKNLSVTVIIAVTDGTTCQRMLEQHLQRGTHCKQQKIRWRDDAFASDYVSNDFCQHLRSFAVMGDCCTDLFSKKYMFFL